MRNTTPGVGGITAWASAAAMNDKGVAVAEVCRKMGISEATCYNWQKKYGGLGVPETRCLKQLQEENQQLKQLVADLSLDKQMLPHVLKQLSKAHAASARGSPSDRRLPFRLDGPARSCRCSVRAGTTGHTGGMTRCCAAGCGNWCRCACATVANACLRSCAGKACPTSTSAYIASTAWEGCMSAESSPNAAGAAAHWLERVEL
ncbi:transposase [Hymenobacter elongatus]|uniref:Transposase n=1 Tax=Hymenobacter elongatus TaxID=877208 RepID=A0A4Z0PF25_9BACT|nr:transposase [Hymenobacter elongatus]